MYASYVSPPRYNCDEDIFQMMITIIHTPIFYSYIKFTSRQLHKVIGLTLSEVMIIFAHLHISPWLKFYFLTHVYSDNHTCILILSMNDKNNTLSVPVHPRQITLLLGMSFLICAMFNVCPYWTVGICHHELSTLSSVITDDMTVNSYRASASTLARRLHIWGGILTFYIHK